MSATQFLERGIKYVFNENLHHTIIIIIIIIIYSQPTLGGSNALFKFVSSSPIWTNSILLISLLAFFLLRTATRIRKHKKVLPLLQNLSSGPFSSTRKDQEGIIHPLLNYNRRNVKKLTFRNQDENVKDQGETEILNAMKLIEQQDVKFIDEDQTKKEDRKEGKPIHQTTLISDPGNVGKQ